MLEWSGTTGCKKVGRLCYMYNYIGCCYGGVELLVAAKVGRLCYIYNYIGCDYGGVEAPVVQR